MFSERPGAILTKDIKILETIEIPEKPESLAILGVLKFFDPKIRDIFTQVLKHENERLELIGRSGHSRFGLDVNMLSGNNFELSKEKVHVQLEASYLIEQFREKIMETILKMGPGEDIEIGRFLIKPEKLYSSEVQTGDKQNHLPKSKIHELIDEKKLALSNYVVLDDGTIELQLEDFLSVIDSRYLKDQDIIRKILIGGKHEVKRIQTEHPSGLPDKIAPKEFVLSGFKISTISHIAVIDKVLPCYNQQNEMHNNLNVYHLAARVLDPLRTTGVDIVREAEIYNGSDQFVDLKNHRIRIKLFDPEIQKQIKAFNLWNNAIENKFIDRIHKTGIGFKDVPELFNVDILRKLMLFIDDKNHAMIVAQNRMGFVENVAEDLEKIPDANTRKKFQELNRIKQNQLITFIAEKVFDNSHNYAVVKSQMPPDLAQFSENLDYIGGKQNKGKVFIAKNIPDVSVIEVLANLGVGVFIAENVDEDDIYMDSAKYETMFKLTREKDMRFYIILNNQDKENLYELYKGFWVRVDKKEDFNKISTIVAMFGTHSQSHEAILKSQINKFFAKLVESGLFGKEAEQLAITHGKGPGIMLTADTYAFINGIMTIGVGIDARESDQVANLKPKVQLDFKGDSTTKRQEIMDQLSIFKIYNIGGYGTQEEFAMARKNTKLCYYFIGPHIYVDPLCSEKKQHHWEETRIQNEKIAKSNLGKNWINNNSHFVGSYDEAFEVIQEYAKNPSAYWKKCGISEKEICTSLRNGVEIFNKYGINIPPFLKQELDKRKIEY